MYVADIVTSNEFEDSKIKIARCIGKEFPYIMVQLKCLMW